MRRSAISRILPYRLCGKLSQVVCNDEYEKKSSRFECAISHLRAWFENHKYQTPKDRKDFDDILDFMAAA